MSLILLGILNSQAAAAGAASNYELLETKNITSNTTSVTFTGLGSYTDYKHLQLRFTVKSDAGTTGISEIYMTINGVTSNSYANHYLRSDGSVVQAIAYTSQSEFILEDMAPNRDETNVFGAAVIDILDFSSTTKNKTLRSFYAAYPSTNRRVTLHSGLFANTAAMTSLQIYHGTHNIVSGSRFSLYGIRG